MRPDNLKGQTLTGIRGKVAAFIENSRFTSAITVLILINAVTLGMATDDGLRASYGPLLETTDHVILAVFVVELLLKIFVYRLSFFRAGWNIFDFVIVGVSLVPASAGLSIGTRRPVVAYFPGVAAGIGCPADAPCDLCPLGIHSRYGVDCRGVADYFLCIGCPGDAAVWVEP